MDMAGIYSSNFLAFASCGMSTLSTVSRPLSGKLRVSHTHNPTVHHWSIVLGATETKMAKMFSAFSELIQKEGVWETNS